jgi:Fe-S cluster biogenesis protein NfuA
MDAPKTVSATFAINTYQLTVVQPANGSITPATATYNHGTVVNLTATPATGYHFVEWTGACTGSGACSVTMDAPKTVSATFAINTYQLTVNQPANGSITPATATYNHGTVVNLTATPATGYHFVEWTGACTGSGACSVTMDAPKTVSATFAINTYQLTVVQPANGSITPTTASYNYGTVVNLTATPATGYHFVEWTGACTGSGACSVTMDAPKTVSATFAINTYLLTVNQPANGSITPATATYNHGTVVNLTATPATGYHFVEWTGACTGSGACSVTMDAPKTVSATFAINTYLLTVVQPANGSITPATATYNHGTVVNLTATPATGYHFVQWTGACTGSGALAA